MIRLLSAAATFSALLLVSPTVASAAPQGPYYVAAPAAAPTEASYVTRNTIWACNAQARVAGKAPDRAEVMCERIVKEVGKLASFTAGGSALDADALAKCNARAD
jgi:hypothetical protein